MTQSHEGLPYTKLATHAGVQHQLSAAPWEPSLEEVSGSSCQRGRRANKQAAEINCRGCLLDSAIISVPLSAVGMGTLALGEL